MIALRLSALRMSSVPGEPKNRIQGHVTDVTYRGDRVVATARTPVGDLRVEDLTARMGAFSPHQEVWVCWSPDAGTVVQDDRAVQHSLRERDEKHASISDPD